MLRSFQDVRWEPAPIRTQLFCKQLPTLSSPWKWHPTYVYGQLQWWPIWKRFSLLL